MTMENQTSPAPASDASPALAQASGSVVRLPVGTRIRFLKTLTSPADEFSPGNLYASAGETGEVTGHGCTEGHMVKTDHWSFPFGAVFGEEFITSQNIPASGA